MNYGRDPDGKQIPIAVDKQGRIIISPATVRETTVVQEATAQSDSSPSRFLDWLKSKLRKRYGE